MPSKAQKMPTSDGAPTKTDTKDKKMPSQIEEFLRCANKANIKTTEIGDKGEHWEVVGMEEGKGNKGAIGEEDWVFIV
jgi:hypothetical protein